MYWGQWAWRIIIQTALTKQIRHLFLNESFGIKNRFQFQLIFAHNQLKSYWASRHSYCLFNHNIRTWNIVLIRPYYSTYSMGRSTFCGGTESDRTIIHIPEFISWVTKANMSQGQRSLGSRSKKVRLNYVILWPLWPIENPCRILMGALSKYYRGGDTGATRTLVFLSDHIHGKPQIMNDLTKLRKLCLRSIAKHIKKLIHDLLWLQVIQSGFNGVLFHSEVS